MADADKIGSGAGVDDWIDCADILGEMTIKDGLAAIVGVDLGKGDSFTMSRDGRRIYAGDDAVLKIFELSGVGLGLDLAIDSNMNMFYVAVAHLGMHMSNHIDKDKCIGGGYFVELDEICKIIDIECASCGGVLREINIG